MKKVFYLSSRSWRVMPFLALLMLFNNSISAQCDVNGGTLEGGPFEFCVDGVPDNVSGITLADNEGMNNQWIVTDAEGNILGMPPMPGVVDFDGAGTGVCLIWNVAYDDIDGLANGNNVSGLTGCYDISNAITVVRTTDGAACSAGSCDVASGTLEGGPFEFCVDGKPDMVSGITLDGNTGESNIWVITDAIGDILGLPPMPGVVDFDGAGAGICLIWNVSFDGTLTGAEMGQNLFTDLSGCYSISNAISVTRTDVPTAGVLTGGPFEFCVDGTPDMVSGITLEQNSGSINQWLITDEAGNILGLPPMPGVVDFDGAGAGVCLIWNITSNRQLEGIAVGNNVSDITGCFALSNSVTVTRNEAVGGTLEGGPFNFCVDGTPDMVSGITLDGNTGANSQWVITDEDLNILGLPPMPGVVDFDGAGAGVCLIWNISYADGLTGLAMNNNVADLVGCYALSNSVTVNRTEANGGTLTGGPYEICVDGIADNIMDITLAGNTGQNSGYVVTDATGMILGLPPMPSAVDFDGAGTGICQIYHISYTDGLEGLSAGNNLQDLGGCFDLSNAVSVTRTTGGAACQDTCGNSGGIVAGGPFSFCVDGTPDMVSGITLTGNDGTNDQWVITDAAGLILGLPPMPGVVDFDGAGVGVCLIWNVSYEAGLTGLDADSNLFTDLEGCYSISNPVTVTRSEVNAGTLEGGPFNFCVDGTPDMVSGITLSGNDGESNQWLITDEAGNILGLPPMPGVVDFDEAGPGVCLIWNLSYDGTVTNVEVGMNVSAIEGCHSISNSVTVTRTSTAGGTLEGGPFEFCVDGTPDMVSGITLTGNEGQNSQWLITDADGTILGLPPMPGVVDFDGAGAGVCFIWNIEYADGLEGLEANNNVSDLVGCYSLSNSIEVVRTGFEGGTLEGGPFEFCVDGTPDMVSGITLDGNTGSMNQWLITDEAGNILGLPPMPGVVDFDGAGAGICLIWNISSDEALTNVEVGMNVSAIEGCYGLSNAITVTRIEAIGGTLAGGPFEFCVDDEADFVSGITLEGNSGPNDQWIVTDEAGMILGLPPMPGAVDFNAAGAGVCLIWNVSYADDLEGLEAGNNVSELVGCFDISNSIVVTRTQTAAGMLEGGPFEFCVDGTPDMVSDITLTGNEGANSQWIVTDVDGMILGLPPMPGAVDFDGAGPGICYISHISYADGLEGLDMNSNTADLVGCFSITNEIEVVRNQAEGGTLEGGPYEFCIDSVGDFVTDLVLTGNTGANSQWVVTDLDGNILGLPGDIAMVDFDGADVGECLIWHLSYADGLTGAEMGMNANDLVGCFSLSNAISVTRVSEGPLCVTATAEEELFTFINVYPNPTTDLINVDYETQSTIGDVEVGLYNTQGRLMMNQQVAKGNNTMSFDASNIPGGAYLIRFTFENSTTYKRVIVLK